MALIVQSGARQYLVTPGQKVIVNSVEGEVGDTVNLDLIHASGEDASVKEVSGTIVAHQRGEKVIVAKYKPKSNYRRRYAPRQEETVIEIVVNGAKAAKKEVKKPTTVKKTTKKA